MRLKIQPAVLLFLMTMFLFSCKDEEVITYHGVLQLTRAEANNALLTVGAIAPNIPVDASFSFTFSGVLDTTSVKSAVSIQHESGQAVEPLRYTFANDVTEVTITPPNTLEFSSNYTITISNALRGAQKESFSGVNYQIITENGQLRIIDISINNLPFQSGQTPKNIDFDSLFVEIHFSDEISVADPDQIFSLIPYSQLNYSFSEDKKTLTVSNQTNLDYYRKYIFYISSQLVSTSGLTFNGFSNQFLTGLDPSYKMPLISDEELLDLVQYQTFRYFWDFAHPVSGLTRERNSSGDIVTIGGSGFGLMAILVGIHRNFISRAEGVERLDKIVDFLTDADRFHGAWPHWMNGISGRTIPFGTKDDGADLVETSFMAAGLLTVRQFLDENTPFESILKSKIANLLESIEWNWFTRSGQNVLYWHWSPNYNWDMNMQIRGYNEALITYFMAAMPGQYTVQPEVYHQGWANNGSIINGKTFYGIQLPVGYDYGGPLFFAHYSFLGLSPLNLHDMYANYWIQNVNHTHINMAHCLNNPFAHVGYGEDCWGLTASDDPQGYKVHEPVSGRDNGTITPTAALSSFPFAPEESMKAIRHFYFVLGDKLWGEYGFYDAFNPGEGWWANSYLAIDQGPIIVMIENGRSGLCWELFMSAPEVQEAMIKLGFSN